MNDDLIRELVRRHGTPLFLVDSEHVVDELNRLRDEFRAVYPRTEIAYSVKTNYLPPLIRGANAAGHMIEVVSRHEWEYVRRLGVPDTNVMFNGPVKNRSDISDALAAGVRLNVDSLDELDLVEGLARERGDRIDVGLRVSPELPDGRQSRFGMVRAEMVPRVRHLVDRGLISVRGLHLHFSMDRSAESYASRVEVLSDVATDLGVRPDYIDIGGGLASVLPPSVKRQLGYDVSTFVEYARSAGDAMIRRWGEDGPALVLEPGTATLSGGMFYVCSVVSTRPPNIVVTDGTMFETNPLRSRVSPPIRALGGRVGEGGATVYGATCMEIDVLGSVTPDVGEGDFLVIENVGAYSVVLSPEFIVPRAGVVDLASQELVRPPQTVGTLGGMQ